MFGGILGMFGGICRLLLPLPPPNCSHLFGQMDKPSRHAGGIICVLSAYPPLDVHPHHPTAKPPLQAQIDGLPNEYCPFSLCRRLTW